MPAKGDNITKRKDGLYMGRVVVETPGGKKRLTVYGKRYGDVQRKLNRIRADAEEGLVFDSENLKVGAWLARPLALRRAQAPGGRRKDGA